MAKILIVDDNIMNCKMAMRILEPLQMEVDTAENGKVALDKIGRESYDIVLMDHMMPVMDGVEAVRQLRVMEDGRYQRLPVIALSAATEPEIAEVFREVGMNDFVAKPIQADILYKVLQKWLPEEGSLEQLSVTEEAESDKTEELPDIEGLDVREGVRNSGGVEFFYNLLGIFYQLIDIKTQKIVQCITDNMIRDYTVEVHGLKNTARMIGAMDLSREFEHLEQLGNAEDMVVIEQETPQVLEHYLSYKIYLKPYGTAVSQEGREVPVEELILYLQGICDAMEAFDLDSADEALAQLEKCRIPAVCEALMEKLRAYVADVDMDNVIVTAQEMINVLENERG